MRNCRSLLSLVLLFVFHLASCESRDGDLRTGGIIRTRPPLAPPAPPLLSCLAGHEPADYYCTNSSSVPQPCDPSCMCPSGSSVPCPEKCPPGRVCSGQSGMSYCLIGHWCAENVRNPCPAGTYSDEYGLSTPECSGSCSWFWTSGEAARSCQIVTKTGVVVVVILVCVGLGLLMVMVTKVGSQSMRLRWLTSDQKPREGSIDAAAGSLVRDLVQDKISKGVDALVERIVNQAFPSSATISASLAQFNLSSPAQVQNYVAAARTDLASYLQDELLKHPRLHFDDETYPFELPLWAEVDPTSKDSELSLVAASSVIAAAIRIAVEKDLPQWFARQNEVMPAAEEAKLLSEPASSAPLRWPAVDVELPLALSIAMPKTSFFFSRLRVAYSTSSPDPRTILWHLAILGLDILVILIGFLSIHGASFVTVEVPFDGANGKSLAGGYSSGESERGPSTFRLNWYEVERRQRESFSYNRGFGIADGAQLFQSEFDACTNTYGVIYRVAMMVSCGFFVFVGCFNVLRLATILSQVTRVGRGCYLSAQRSVDHAFSKFQKYSPEFANSYVAAWYLEGGPIAFTRSLGVLCLIAAITLYSLGCIAPLHQSPALAQQDFDAVAGWDSSIWAIRNLVTMVYVDYSVNLQVTFILTLVAAFLSILLAMFMLQHSIRKAVATFENRESESVEQQLEQVLLNAGPRSDMRSSLLPRAGEEASNYGSSKSGSAPSLPSSGV